MSATVSSSFCSAGHRTRVPAMVGVVAAVGALLVGGLASAGRADAAEAPLGLGTSATYSVLGGQAVTNTGPTRLSGDLGVSPGTAISGFPPGVAAGTTHAADAVAAQAQSDLVTAYNDAAGRAPTASVAGDLVGRTLTAGVYNSSSSLALSGTLTLDGQGDPNSVFIVQVASTLITASASAVNVINGAQACHVYWQVGSSATLGTASSFKGTILALTSVTVTTGAIVQGRALARNGQVTLDNNTFTSAACDAAVTPTTAAPVPITTAPTATTAPPVTSTPAPTTPVSATTSKSTTPSSSTSHSSTATTTSGLSGGRSSSTGRGGGVGRNSAVGGTGITAGQSFVGQSSVRQGLVGQGSVRQGSVGSAELANTGAIPLGPPLGAGALLLLVGGGLLVAGRRRAVVRNVGRRH